jgi:hypothetical protein
MMGTRRAHGLEQPFRQGAEQFLRLQVQRRLRQTRITPVKRRGAQEVQPAHRAAQQLPDKGLGRRIPGQLVQVALDRRGGRFFARCATHRPEGVCIGADLAAARVYAGHA